MDQTQPQRPGPPATPPQPTGSPVPGGQQGGSPNLPPGVQAVPVPPDMQRHIDPNNPMQKQLLQRVDSLNPQDLQALNSGVSPPAVQVLKKILPEIGFLLDMIGRPQGGDPAQPGGMPGQPDGQEDGRAGISRPVPGLNQPPGGQGGLPRPGTRLSQV